MEEGLSIGAGVAHISWQRGKDERSCRSPFPAHTAPGRCLVALMHSVSNQLHLALLEQFGDWARDPQK